MKESIMLLLSLLLLFTSAYTFPNEPIENSPEVTLEEAGPVFLSWTLEEYTDQNELPFTDIYLRLEGGVEEEIFIITVNNRLQVLPQDHDRDLIPAEALLVLDGFYAGASDTLYLVENDEGDIEVYYRLLFEARPGDEDPDFSFELLQVIELPEEAQLYVK